MNTDPPKPKKMTSEEVQRMLADFYQEVERREQEEGRAGNDFAACSPPVVRQSTNEKNKNTTNPLKQIQS